MSGLLAHDLVVGRAGFRLGPLDLNLRPGAFLAVIGPNGSGKTTLLKTLAGLVAPVSGRIEAAAAYLPPPGAVQAAFTTRHVVALGRAGRVRWAADLDDQRTKPVHYPDLDKRLLLGDYIASVSGHSRGFTADLTLQRCDAAGACTPLDMGTPFDFFDPRANTDSPEATPAQRANRDRLRDAMRAGGFANYPLEWWHYTLDPVPQPAPLHDVPVE